MIDERIQGIVIDAALQVAKRGIGYQQVLKQQHLGDDNYGFLSSASPLYHFYLTKLREFMKPQLHKPKHGFQDRKIIHIIQNKQRLEDMDVGLMVEIIKDNVNKGLGFGPYTDDQVFRTITIVQDPTKLQQGLSSFLQQVAEDQKQQEKDIKAREAKVQTVFKPEVITVQAPNQTGIRDDGTMFNSSWRSQQRRMGLGKSQDIYEKYRAQLSLKHHFCRKCRNLGHREKDCPFQQK